MASAAFAAVFGDQGSGLKSTQDVVDLRTVWKERSRGSAIEHLLQAADRLGRTQLVPQVSQLATAYSGPSSSPVEDSSFQYQHVLSYFFYTCGLHLLGLPQRSERSYFQKYREPQDVREVLLAVLVQLERAGAINVDTEVALARAADKLMDRLVEKLWDLQHGPQRPGSDVDMSDDVRGAPGMRDGLVMEVRHGFASFIHLVLGPHQTGAPQGWRGLFVVNGERGPARIDWEAIALDKLGQQLSRHMYEIIEDCPVSEGILEDIRSCITTPATRQYLSEQFHRDLAKQLLHPGRSTVEILEMYMKCISTFQDIDPSGIFLSRAAEPIRYFLRMRSDTMRIILTSLLEPSRDEHDNFRQCTESFSVGVAQCMDIYADFEYKEYYEAKDLRDIGWEPEPIDAATGHQKIRSLDALSHLVTLHPADDVIKELQIVFCERLLSGSSSNYEMEMRLLRTFKNRFEELKMQSCDIMLADAITSQSLEREIHHGDASMGAQTTSGQPAGAFHALMLSRYYWPALQEQSFKLPSTVESQMRNYDASFSALKAYRRLAWFHSLGHAHVELELEDRNVEEVVTTWQAAVIYAFNNSDGRKGRPIVRTVSELVDSLAMDEQLVRAALAFWTGKLVLRQKPNRPDTYAVLESLNAPSLASPSSNTTADLTSPSRAVSAATATNASLAAAQAQAQAATSSALKSAADLLQENASVYGNFVVGMLTNQGAMPAARVHMMLKMVVPGGFPYSLEELSGFLVGMEGEGRVERSGVNWRMKRKT